MLLTKKSPLIYNCENDLFYPNSLSELTRIYLAQCIGSVYILERSATIKPPSPPPYTNGFLDKKQEATNTEEQQFLGATLFVNKLADCNAGLHERHFQYRASRLQ